MLHLIAYKDETGRDFGGIPWIKIASDDIEYAERQAEAMALVYKEVVLAECEDEELPETVTWDFIYEHKHIKGNG